MNTLSRQEQSELERLEQTIAGGLGDFRRVGEALARIAEAKLYRADYTSFPAYLAQRWGLGKSQAYRLIAGAETAAAVSPIGDVVPQAESQIRALSRLADPEQRQEAWERAVDAALGKQPTARQVEAAVLEVEAEALERVSLDVAASLPPEQQMEVVAQESQRSRERDDRHERQQQRDARAQRLDRIGHHLGKARKLAEGLGGEAEPFLASLLAPETELRRLEDAA